MKTTLFAILATAVCAFAQNVSDSQMRMNEQAARINNDEINRKLDSLKAAVSGESSGVVSVAKYNDLMDKFEFLAKKFNALMAENKELKAQLAATNQ